MTEWQTAAHVTRPMDGANGKLLVVGIGPGRPDHLTQAAREAIKAADTVYAASLYQEFLDETGLLDDSTVIESSRNAKKRQARETFNRVQSGETVLHVSGGDPNVYGKSDLLVALAETEADGEIPIEIVPGVTAALGGAALLGAPLSNDFCTISLSSQRREQAEIDEKLAAATRAGFVLVLYNGWRSLPEALSIVSEHRPGSVPVAILEDVGRGDRGRNPAGETVAISRLADAASELDPQTPGTLVVIGTEASRVLEPAGDGRPFFVTPRGDTTPFHQ
ncbi:cobalt-precorrin-2 C(20)-methyltransferase [Halodesulfurarchaeum formicicum]|uniref:Cobalt-precorrin-2 C(20)-methyltransferase n=1 Tax=Halodesulfurarchaeum formicicum TaxID=1873524 RepID=A0A1D8S6P7_9EURY|nr:SAM-dependent methyltransferase [Halodesulfurarchaeum formicicum]AOW81009.1 cobalt-precorrin-2 C(20)-methyltransferase [Halodesulfurarchaeum formicicum]